MSEKKTNHSILIDLLSEYPITVDTALFALRKSIDNDILEDSDLLIVYAREIETRPEALTWKPDERAPEDRKPSAAAQQIKEIAKRSPGALGDLYARYGWKGLYVGGAGVIMIAIIAVKWTIRILTGTFF
jgi:hypothetical protein